MLNELCNSRGMSIQTHSRTSETTIIGGGIVGLSVALGLLKKGHRVTVLDGKDSDQRASLGNFGLVWLQGKGADYLAYADWACKAVDKWATFAEDLHDLSGIDPALDQSGGYEIFTELDEYDEYCTAVRRQQDYLGNRFSHEVYDGAALRRRFPGIGPKVVGATYSKMDGHANPLATLRALRKAVRKLGATVINNWVVQAIAAQPGGGFTLTSADGAQRGATRLILCAGLGAARFTRALGFTTRIRPQRGEVMITERLGEAFPLISSTIRQVNEGGLQIGGTAEDVGEDDGQTHAKMSWLAQHAVDVWPALTSVRVIRAWGALRVMTPDSYPVYARSTTFPEAYLITCHSGVSLASLHASDLCDWLDDTTDAPNLEAFDERRFSIPAPR